MFIGILDVIFYSLFKTSPFALLCSLKFKIHEVNQITSKTSMKESLESMKYAHIIVIWPLYFTGNRKHQSS